MFRRVSVVIAIAVATSVVLGGQPTGRFVPELIHNRSGVGSMIQAADLNKDGAIDIIAGTNRGGHIFWGTPRGGRRGGATRSSAAGRQ